MKSKEFKIITEKKISGSQSLWHYRIERLVDGEYRLFYQDYFFGITRWGAINKAKKMIKRKTIGSGLRPKKVTYM